MTAPLRFFGHTPDAEPADALLDQLEAGRAFVSLDGGKTWTPADQPVCTTAPAVDRAADLPIRLAANPAAEADKNYDDARREMGWASPLATATPPAPRTLTARIAGRTLTYRVLPTQQEA